MEEVKIREGEEVAGGAEAGEDNTLTDEEKEEVANE